MDELKKIDLTPGPNKSTKKPDSKDSLHEELTSKRGHKKRNISLGALIVIVLIGLFVIFGIIVPLIGFVAQAKATISQAKLVLAAAKTQNIALAQQELGKARTEMDKLQAGVKGMGYLSFVPPINFYYNDLKHLVNAGSYGLDGGKVLIDSVSPYADVLGLNGTGSFTGGPAEQRIQTTVKTFGKIAPNIDKISASLVAAQKELDQVDPNHYPSIFGGEKVKKGIIDAKTIADEASVFVTQAGPLIKVLPTLLGEPNETKYLILFQNDKELRPTGGFITAYAIMRFEHGVPHPDSSDDIYTLDNSVPGKQAAPRLLQEYLPKVPLLNLRDTNLSPDFIVSMDEFNKLYTKAGGYKKIDGIIGIDTYPLVHALDVLGGSIQVDGQIFTTKNDPRCDCPNVIYQLEVAADQPVEFIKTNRKGVVGDLMIAIMTKALTAKPKQYWGPLFQAMLNDIAEKHILFDIYNKDAQAGIEALNAGGRINNFTGDYLHINEANFGGAKSNMYVSEDVSQNYAISGDGSVTKTVTINYKNPFPPSDCNLERGNLCLNAILRDVVRVYVPKGSELVSSQGSEVKMISYDELGKTVFEGFLTVRPQGTAKFVIAYKLPFKLDRGSPLPAMYQKQPGTAGFQYTVSVNNNKVDQFQLLQDKTIKINP